ncbi:phosphatidic acid phosphatase type 2/haloperoxidase [Gaertneriomyces semiglobifer]|nr:phosphatidic acid phosphatase type 2/haloperoxidase [Gaertneriomyces semiglobifer]
MKFPPRRSSRVLPNNMTQRCHVLYAIRTNNVLALLKECSYEWIGVILLAAAGAALELVQPFQRVAFGTDLSIAYPHNEHETVPNWLLGVLGIALPIVVMCIVSLAFKRSVFDLHMSILGLAIALSFVLLLTQIVKVVTGSLRPDFLDRCQPIFVAGDPFKRVESCQGDPDVIKEGRKSFFSGHSSFSWAGLGFLSIYLSRHMNFRRAPLFPKYFIAILPLILAYLIAMSRVRDYWHRWQDIVVGAIVGFIVASVSYRQHCSIFEEIDQGYQGARETDRLATGMDRDERRMTTAMPPGDDAMTHSQNGDVRKNELVIPIDDKYPPDRRGSASSWTPMYPVGDSTSYSR